MKNGELFDGGTLDRLYSRQIKMQKIWWNQ
jgi:hypothetical protein